MARPSPTAGAGGATAPTLARHLDDRLGRWPPPAGTLAVVGSPRRERPGWDGRVEPLVGVLRPDGGMLSVPPAAVAPVRALVARHAGAPSLDVLRRDLPAVLGEPRRAVDALVLRWSTEPADLDALGVWASAADPRLPAWLHPFGGQVLVALDERERYLAGVGIKRHGPYGCELAVGTETGARGRGLARRLVAHATRAVLEEGLVATYVHQPDNAASARVAAAAGFPAAGWWQLTFADADADADADDDDDR